MKTIITLLLPSIASLTFAQNDPGIKLTSLAWSPDGNQLIFSAIAVKPDWSDYNEANWKLLFYDMTTGEFRKIEDGAMFGTISPDGCRIAYEKTENGNKEIFLEDICTGQRQNLTNHPGRDGAPVFSPDGKKLVFVSDRAGAREIFILDIEKPEALLMQVTHAAPHKSYNPEWSSDGSQFVYYLEKGDNKDQIWLTDTAGKNPRNVSNDTLHSFYPAWTPRGELIFTSLDGKLVVMKPDGSDRRILPGITGFLARISTRKKRIAYIRREADGIVIAKYPRLRQLRVIDGASLQGKGFW